MKHSNILSIGVPEGEEEEQEIVNLFEQMMKENFPNLAKGIDFQEVQEAQGVPKKLDTRRNTPRHIIIKSPMVKGKERILKAERKRKGDSYLQRGKTVSCFLQRKLAGKKGLERSIPSHERQGPTSKIALSSKAFI